jgi:hypothetical protein
MVTAVQIDDFGKAYAFLGILVPIFIMWIICHSEAVADYLKTLKLKGGEE